MNTISFGPTDLQVPELSLGCMRMRECEPADAQAVLAAAMESGITFFDHADIYGGGKAEEVFADAMEALGLSRESLFLQSKCGIRKGVFDFSREHLISSVDGILSRLRTGYLDALLLHRPDALMEPEEVAGAFSELRAAGKVRHFGVSNQNPTQMALLARAVDAPLVANQVQLGLGHTPLIDRGFNVNLFREEGVDRDGGTLGYCQLHDMTVQPWSPLQTGFFEGVFLGHPDYPELNAELERIAADRNVDPSAVSIAWLLRIPGSIQPVLGSMNPDRIRAMARAGDVKLTREEWYRLYRSTGKVLP